MKGSLLQQKTKSIKKSIFVMFFSVTMIPIIILSAILLLISTNTTRQNIINQSNAELYHNAVLMNARIQECKNVALAISGNNLLSERNMLSESYNTVLGINELKKYKAANDYVLDLGIIYPDQERIYSYMGMSSIPALMQSIYRLSEDDQEQFVRAVKSDEEEQLVCFKDTKQILFIKKIRMAGEKSRKFSVCFMLSYDIANSFFDPGEKWVWNRIIVDTHGDIVFSRDNNSTQYIDIVKNQVSELPSAVSVHNQSNCVLLSASLNNFSARLVEILNFSRINLLLYQSIYLPILMIIGTLFICCIVASKVAFKAFLPIGQIQKIIEENKMLSANEKSENEIDTIRHIVEKYHNIEDKYIQTSSEHRTLTICKLLTQLLRGNIEPDIYNYKIHLPFLFRPDVRIRVCVTAKENQNAFVSFINEKSEQEGHRGDNFYLVFDNSIVLVLCSNQSEVDDENLIHLSKLANDLEISVGIGTCVRSHETLVNSFIQAFAAFDYLLINQKTGIAIYGSDVLEFNHIDILKEDSDLFLQSLIIGNQETSLFLMNSILSKISILNFDSPFAKKILNSISTIIETASEEISGNAGTSEKAGNIGRALSNRIILLDYQQSIEEYRELGEKIIKEICCVQRRAGQMGNMEESSQVMEFVNQHALDEDFSLSLLTDTFGHSNQYWSSLFREKYGVFFTDLVWNIRLKYVKEQLVFSTDTISQIVKQAGYIDQTSFSRKFKAAVGVTPGQYRKLYGRKEITDDRTLNIDPMKKTDLQE